MLETKPITKEFSDLRVVREMLTTLFPTVEQIPFWFLLMRAKKDFTRFLAYYDGDVFVGTVYMITHNDLTYVLYIAVNDKIQSKGYGSRILSQVRNLYPNNRIMLNIEAPDENADNNAQRQKRRDFYIKNEYTSTGFFLVEKVMVYETLILGGSCEIEEYEALFKKFAGALLYPFVKPKLRYM